MDDKTVIQRHLLDPRDSARLLPQHTKLDPSLPMKFCALPAKEEQTASSQAQGSCPCYRTCQDERRGQDPGDMRAPGPV